VRVSPVGAGFPEIPSTGMPVRWRSLQTLTFHRLKKSSKVPSAHWIVQHGTLYTTLYRQLVKVPACMLHLQVPTIVFGSRYQGLRPIQYFYSREPISDWRYPLVHQAKGLGTTVPAGNVVITSRHTRHYARLKVLSGRRTCRLQIWVPRYLECN
jgi:hypothetical protein